MYLSIASCQRTASMRLPSTTIALALPVEQRRDVLAEMLDDDLDLLGDVVGMQPHPAHDALQRRAAFDLLVVQLLAVMREPEGQLVGRVVLQHVEDEAFLDRLPHRIDVERLRAGCRRRRAARVRAAAEQLQRLGLGRGREGDIGDALVAGARRHLRREHIFGADLAAVSSSCNSSADSTAFNFAAASPVCEECASSAITANRLPCVAASSCTAFERKGKGLDRADDDLLAAASASASSPLLLAPSPLIVATTPVVRSKSKSASCSCASITLRSETTSTVSNSFSCLASCRSARKCADHAMELVLPEPAECWIRYLPPAPSSQHGGLQLPRGVELVIARKDDACDLLLLVLLRHEVAAEDLQPAIALPRPPPTDRPCGARFGFGGIARRAVVALVERQEARRCAPSSCVVMWTSLLLTAKCTSAPLGKLSSGSAALPFGSGGGRSGTGRWRHRRSG